MNKYQAEQKEVRRILRLIFKAFEPQGKNMRAAKVDANQTEIVAALRRVGASVQILSSVGQGCPDIICGIGGRNYFLEIKDGKKPPSAQKLTIDQFEWHGSWKGQVAVVNSVKQAYEAIGVKTNAN